MNIVSVKLRYEATADGKTFMKSKTFSKVNPLAKDEDIRNFAKATESILGERAEVYRIEERVLA
ncbi:MAG: DUF1659 domain-containing protein [Tissierellia bacterium]|nr:DUF1659 domain-containing protein [Tissierellia bacterium]